MRRICFRRILHLMMPLLHLSWFKLFDGWNYHAPILIINSSATRCLVIRVKSNLFMCCCACNKYIQRDFLIFYLEVWILDVNQRICFFYSKLRVHRSLSLRKFLVSIFLIYISVAEEVCLKSAQSQYRRAINRASEIQSQYRRAWVLNE